MSLPRPINWLHTGDVDEDAREEVLMAGVALKKELDAAMGSLGDLESANQDTVETLNQTLNQIIGGVGGQTRVFIVSTWFGFLPDDVPPEIENIRFASTPFKSVELAVAYANTLIELMQSMASAGVDIRPRPVEDTPDDIISKFILSDSNDVPNGYLEIKYWQYNPEVVIPEGSGGGNGDWV